MSPLRLSQVGPNHIVFSADDKALRGEGGSSTRETGEYIAYTQPVKGWPFFRYPLVPLVTL